MNLLINQIVNAFSLRGIIDTVLFSNTKKLREVELLFSLQ